MAAEDRFFVMQNVRLECGVTLPELRIAYRVDGELNAERDNAIVTGTSFGATPDNLDYLVGPGRALDTDRYCVIRTHMIGNGVSSSPSNTPPPFDGPRFPTINIRDNVTAQYRLLTEGMGIQHIRAYLGASMGAQQAYQWAVSYVDFVDWIIPIVGGAHTTDHGYAMLEAWRQAILFDPAFEGGDYREPPLKGLRLVGAIWSPWGFSQEFLARQQYKTLGFDSLGQFLTAAQDRFAQRDANNFLCQLGAWQRHNVGDTPGFSGDYKAALRSIKAKALVLPGRTDTYFALPDLMAEAELVPDHQVKVIDSIYGHQAGFAALTADAVFVGTAIGAALKER